MTSEAKTSAAGHMTYRMAAANLAALAAITALVAAYDISYAGGVAAGYILGAANMFWLLRIVTKGMGLDASKAGGFVLKRYYARFIVTALIFAALVIKGVFPALPLIGGLAGAMLVTIIVMISFAREEAF